MSSQTTAQLYEIFNSIQGEGLYVGERQIFIRFAGCNLSCQYCDTPQSQNLTPEFKVEQTPGKRDFKNYPNPATVTQLLEIVGNFNKHKGLNHAISLTGGEPLLQVDFLKTSLPILKKEIGLFFYLETNGVLPDHLAEIIEWVDIIALDIKLPSATGLSPYWKEHRKTLETAALQNVFVKIIFTRETPPKEIDDATSLIAEVSVDIPLILQPVTPHGSIKHRPQPEQILAAQAIAKRKLQTVRVIPQAHKIFGMV
ncbi:7-carboxy-7-deazaguanine synthase QueE [Candidatus Saganbacteria bacterium]|nr:7-carboxy-7-deazaguanine synthase QueE [Candidatus Saganbacteria bacterium]